MKSLIKSRQIGNMWKFTIIIQSILPFLLLVGTKSHSLTITYSADTVKKNSSNYTNLESNNKVALALLKSKYTPVDTHQNSVFLNAANNVHNDNTFHNVNLENTSQSLKNTVQHWSKVVVIVIILTSTFAILMISIIREIDSKIEDTQDTFLKNAYNVCYRQIALIGVINLVLWLILQTKVATKLDNFFFYGDVDYSNLKNELKPIIEPVFECLLSVSVILLAWYIIYAIYFQFVVRRITSWMRKTDNCDVSTVAKELEILEQNWFYACFRRHVFNRGNFLANRFEFIDNINNMNSSKIDPSGYYFMEYLRANILDFSVQMLKFPKDVLVLVMLLSVILRKTLNFVGRNEVLLISGFSIFCAVSMIVLAIYTFLLERKLYPSKLSEYLMFKHNTSGMEISKYSGNSILPPYKLAKLDEEPNNVFIRFVHGDTPVNKHENLFIFKSKGPKILMKIFELICFSFLLVLSIWVYLIKQHESTWLEKFSFGLFIILSSIFVIGFLIPKVLYSLIVVSKTGLLIDHETVEKVWEANRSNNTKHAMEIIDALNLDAVMTSLNRNGDTYWRHLVGKLKTSPLAVQKQMSDVWSGLDRKKKGYIGTDKILRYMTSQGLQIHNNRRIKEFIKSFTRTEPHKIFEEEFLVLGLVVKQIIIVPLDTAQMKVLFEEVYRISWTSPTGIDSNSLQYIIKQLGLKWNEGDRRHLLDFLSGGRCDGMSAENFINQLSTVEQLLKSNNYKNIGPEI